MTTPLHDALGIDSRDLDIDLVKRACAESVAEAERLDFKQVLPLPTTKVSPEESTSRRLELAKDLAAMANGRGGMIVYGVSDSNNRASEIVDVGDLSGGSAAKGIRQVAYNQVYPPLQVRCTPLGGEGERVLVVEVDESDDAPHLVLARSGGQQGWLIAPYRSGPDTQNMLEKQLEQAYKDRFEGRRLKAEELETVYDGLIERYAPYDNRNASFAVVAVPHRSARFEWGSNPANRLKYIVSTAAARTFALGQAYGWSLPSTLFAVVDGHGSSVRRGLRCWTYTASHVIQGAGDEPAELVVEISDLGSIAILWRSGDTYNRTGNLSTERCLARDEPELIALLTTYLLSDLSEAYVTPTDYTLRTGLDPRSSITLIHDDERWKRHTQTVPPSRPFTTDLRLTGGPDARASDILGFLTDVANLEGRDESVLERLWWRGKNQWQDVNEKNTTTQLFGGSPNHPESGRPL